MAANPYAGHPSDIRKTVWEFSIPRPPFIVVYRVMPTQIEVFGFGTGGKVTNTKTKTKTKTKTFANFTERLPAGAGMISDVLLQVLK